MTVACGRMAALVEQEHRQMNTNGGTQMGKTVDQLSAEIHDLPDVEKLRLVDSILSDLDKPDPEIDRVWAEEARMRWAAYKSGRISAVPYETVMAKHRRS